MNIIQPDKGVCLFVMFLSAFFYTTITCLLGVLPELLKHEFSSSPASQDGTLDTKDI